MSGPQRLSSHSRHNSFVRSSRAEDETNLTLMTPLLDFLPDAVAVIGRGGEIRHRNEEFLKHFGGQRSPQGSSIFDCVEDHERAALICTFNRVMQSEASLVETVEGCYLTSLNQEPFRVSIGGFRNSGVVVLTARPASPPLSSGRSSRFPLKLPSIPNSRSNSSVFPVLGPIAKTSEDSSVLLRAKEELERTLEVKRQFVRSVSHEIRTPLNVIINGLFLLDTSPALDEGAREMVEEMRTSCSIAVGMLNDLLTYEKIDGETLEADLRPICARTLLNDSLSMFRSVAKHSQVALSFHNLVEGSAIVHADPHKFGQVLRNLLSNAFKFTPKGCRVEVELAVREADESGGGDWVVFSVKDEGPGIAPEDQPRLFGQFVQFNAAELQAGGGSGLGLWISKKIVCLHGGRIRVQSEPAREKGCTFFVELPLDSLEAGEAVGGASILSRRSPSATASSLHSFFRPRVLLVDDSPLNRKMLMRLLHDKCEVCDEAESGQQAVDKVLASMAEGHPYDGVIVDSVMPLMSGPEVVRSLRAQLFDGKLIGLTGNSSKEDIDLFRDCGAENVLLKPIGYDEMMQLLAEFSQVAHQRQRATRPLTSG